MRLDHRMDEENEVHLYNRVLHSGKNSDILKFAGKWMELENIILSGVTQTQKDKYITYKRLLDIKQRKTSL